RASASSPARRSGVECLRSFDIGCRTFLLKLVPLWCVTRPRFGRIEPPRDQHAPAPFPGHQAQVLILLGTVPKLASQFASSYWFSRSRSVDALALRYSSALWVPRSVCLITRACGFRSLREQPGHLVRGIRHLSLRPWPN